MEYSVLAPAKVNLFLDVLSKREDGYHEIKSVMQTVSLYDEIFLNVKDSEAIEIEVRGSSSELKWDESNLVYKACVAFLKAADINRYRFEFYVDKHIPICAGMAGGSTDAAGALLLLNKAFNNIFSVQKLCKIGAALGADVAFCIMGGTCLCEGIGEKLTPVSSFAGRYMVCAIDESSISTPRAYALLDEKYGTCCGDSADIKLFLNAIEYGSTKDVCSLLYNKFEGVIVPNNPNIEIIKRILSENGASGALMSGSGPSVFGIFESEDDQIKAYEVLKKDKITAFLCKSI